MLGRKVIYVRCMSCSYNNVAKGILSLTKNQFLFIQDNLMQVRAFERYISLKCCLKKSEYHVYLEEGKDQESLQSSTTPDPGPHKGK